MEILPEREWQDRGLEISSRQMSGEFRTEHVRVTSRDIEDIVLPCEPVDKQLPMWEVLDLVEKQDPGIVVHRVYRNNNLIVIDKADESLVIEIDVPEFPS